MQNADDLLGFGVEVPRKVWRVSLKRYVPLTPPPKAAQGKGRFDDPIENDLDGFGVLYCGTSLNAAFIETLGGFRRKIGVIEELLSGTLLTAEERDASNELQLFSGIVPEDWMRTVQVASGNIVTSSPVFDLANPSAVQTLRFYLAPTLIALQLDDLDFSHVLGDNRDLTRAISRWIWSMKTDSGDPLFAGIRYRSRFDPECICLALYQDRFRVEGEVVTQPVTPNTPGFSEATTTLRLHIR